MSVFSKPSNGDSKTSIPRTMAPPPIPLNRPATVELKKGDYVTVKLRSVPSEENSQTYDLNIGIFRSGTAEAFLEFRRNLKKAIVGQHITTGPPMFSMARRLMAGDALSVFNNRAAELGAETTANFKQVMNALAAHVFPQRALRMQKRYMRRYMRKPKGQTTREYIARVNEINEYLSLFPPFEADQKLPTDEILDILEFGMPATWQREFWRQGFDPIAHSIEDFTEFCERLEFTEEMYDETHASKKRPRVDRNSMSKESGNSKGRIKPEGKKPKKSNTWCDYHQTDSHTTGDCKVVLAQARKMRAAWENKSDSDKKPSRNKSNSNELNALVQKEIKKQLNAAKQSGTKRKRSKSKDGSDEEYEHLDNIEEFELLELSESDKEE